MTSRASTFTLRLSQIAVAPRHARVGSGSSCHPANRRRLRFVKSPRDAAKKPVASPGILNQEETDEIVPRAIIEYRIL